MDNLTYEEAVKELSQIIEKLESGHCALNEALILLQRGKDLVSFCYTSLSNAKGKLTEVKEVLGKLEEL